MSYENHFCMNIIWRNLMNTNHLSPNKLENQNYAFSKKGIRQNKILFLLSKHKHLTNKELCQELNCSEVTIRNDLRELSELNLIERTFGGASALDDTYGGISISEHLEYSTAEKYAISNYVIKNIIKPQQSIIVDTGSTCLALCERLSQYDGELGIVTNSLLNANYISQNPNLTLTIPGGVYNPTSDTLDSISTLSYYQNIYADCYFMSSNGLTANGVSLTMTADANRAMIKKTIVEQASKVILLCDHTKINKTCFHRICGLEKISLIVTDNNCSDEERSAFESLSVPVVFAPL